MIFDKMTTTLVPSEKDPSQIPVFLSLVVHNSGSNYRKEKEKKKQKGGIEPSKGDWKKHLKEHL